MNGSILIKNGFFNLPGMLRIQTTLFLYLIALVYWFKDWSSLLANIEKTENMNFPATTKPKQAEGFSNDIHLLHHQISMSLTTQTITAKKIISLCRQLGSSLKYFR